MDTRPSKAGRYPSRSLMAMILAGLAAILVLIYATGMFTMRPASDGHGVDVDVKAPAP